MFLWEQRGSSVSLEWSKTLWPHFQPLWANSLKAWHRAELVRHLKDWLEIQVTCRNIDHLHQQQFQEKLANDLLEEDDHPMAKRILSACWAVRRADRSKCFADLVEDFRNWNWRLRHCGFAWTFSKSLRTFLVIAIRVLWIRNKTENILLRLV